MFRCVGIGANEAENHVCLFCRRRPDFLPIDHIFIAIKHGSGTQTGKIRTRTGFGVSLTPDHLTAQRRLDPAPLLFLRAILQKRRYQHRNALIGRRWRCCGFGEGFRYQSRFENIRLRAMTSIFFRNGPGLHNHGRSASFARPDALGPESPDRIQAIPPCVHSGSR